MEAVKEAVIIHDPTGHYKAVRGSGSNKSQTVKD